jgi:hypothetical protein
MATRPQVEKTIDSRLDAALVAGKSRRARGDLAKSVAYDAKRRRLQVELVSGIAIAIPVAHVECLASAKPAAIRAVQITGNGSGLRWDALDADLSVPDLVAGCFGTRTWMKSLARRAGRVTSEAKAAAARENGKKGGRPRKPRGEGHHAV